MKCTDAQAAAATVHRRAWQTPCMFLLGHSLSVQTVLGQVCIAFHVRCTCVHTSASIVVVHDAMLCTKQAFPVMLSCMHASRQGFAQFDHAETKPPCCTGAKVHVCGTYALVMLDHPC